MLLSVSRIHMPFAYRKNRWYEELSPLMNQEMVERGLIRPDQCEYHTGFNLLNAFFFPIASRQVLLMAARMIDFFFLCDDIYDTTSKNGRNAALIEDLLASNVEVIRTGVLPPDPDPLNRLAYDTIHEFAASTTPAQLRRLADSVGDYLLGGSLALMKLWARNEIPSIEAYARLRQSDVAMYPTINVSEVVGGVRLPEEVWGHALLGEMRSVCNLQVALANDILSYHKEVVRDRCPYNMVYVVAFNRGLSIPEAVLEVIEMVNACTRRFLEIEDELPPFGEPIDGELRRYVQGMKDLIAGNWYWSFESTRYSSADSPFVELRTTSDLIYEKSRGLLVTQVAGGNGDGAGQRAALAFLAG